MNMEVVGLGAWCDLDHEAAGPSNHHSASSPAGWSALAADADRGNPAGVHLRVHEFATLADGRRVLLRDDLGFSTSIRRHDYDSGRTHALDSWDFMSRESLESDVRNVVLPDDDASAEEHPYAWLSELLLEQGIEASAERLRSLPYVVEFSDRLERRLRP